MARGSERVKKKDGEREGLERRRQRPGVGNSAEREAEETGWILRFPQGTCGVYNDISCDRNMDGGVGNWKQD